MELDGFSETELWATQSAALEMAFKKSERLVLVGNVGFEPTTPSM